MTNTPQFSTAEYAGKSGDRCKSCNRALSGDYFRINGMLACNNCAERVRQSLPKDSHSAFVRGVIFGVGGAILGLILYSAFSIITGLIIGYISLAVGFIVGKAILMGSKGIGGRRYQIAAALLTYAAVSMAAIPVAISQAIKARDARPANHASATGTAKSQSADISSGGELPPPPAPRQKPDVLMILGQLIFVGLASPFLELQNPVSGTIGLVILVVGIRIAWRMTAGKPLEILGPFKAASEPAPA